MRGTPTGVETPTTNFWFIYFVAIIAHKLHLVDHLAIKTAEACISLFTDAEA